MRHRLLDLARTTTRARVPSDSTAAARSTVARAQTAGGNRTGTGAEKKQRFLCGPNDRKPFENRGDVRRRRVRGNRSPAPGVQQRSWLSSGAAECANGVPTRAAWLADRGDCGDTEVAGPRRFSSLSSPRAALLLTAHTAHCSGVVHARL